MSNKHDFSGKVVVITGSSSGIGASTAEEFASAGAQVVITGRNEEKLAEVGKLCLKASPKGLKALEVVGDVTNEEDCKRLIDSTIKEFGKLDILVNNAGAIAGGIGSLDDPDILKKFDKMINLNLRSVVYLTHLSVKHLEKTKGNIINISTHCALVPMHPLVHYGMSKVAMDYFSKCCALELGPKGIRVNIINPASVLTNFRAAVGIPKKVEEEHMKKMEPVYPLGRHGTPLEVAGYIMFLASDQCSWITGSNFVADGGLTHAPMPKLS